MSEVYLHISDISDVRASDWFRIEMIEHCIFIRIYYSQSFHRTVFMSIHGSDKTV